MNPDMNADTRTNEELLEAARNGDQDALAALVERHRDRLERMARLRMDRRLQGRFHLSIGQTFNGERAPR